MTFTSKASLEKDLLIINYPKAFKYVLEKLIDLCARKNGGMINVTIGRPKRKRTTGPRSQNSKVWGMVQDIVEQFHDAGQEDVKIDQVYLAFKRMAVSEGYPTRYNPIDGIEEPESQSRVSVEQDMILINVIQRFADENSMYLTEYVDGVPKKTVGGSK